MTKYTGAKIYWAEFNGIDLSNPRKPRIYFLINGQHDLSGERVGIHVIRQEKIRILWGTETHRLLEDGLFHWDELISNGNGKAKSEGLQPSRKPRYLGTL